MCGIAGFINSSKDLGASERKALATSLHEAIAHRGPDDADIWLDPESGVTLAHRRLAIIDLSPEGRQPMASASGRYQIVFNGEIYNFPELRAQLEDLGYTFRGRSDTEIMLAAFDHWGLNLTLQKLDGMFAFAVWDRQEKQLHLVRDRFGKKPLYVGWVGNNLVFASELKSFFAFPGFEKTISREALTNYMAYGYIHAPFSIFENVWQLLPAARMTIRLDKMDAGSDLSEKMESYWFLPRVTMDAREHRIHQNDADVIEDFEARLKQCVKARMISDVPLGAFLSGGIDSSAIVALMQAGSAQAIKTFSIGFEDGHYNEAPHAAKIADFLGTDHTEFIVTARDALDVIPKLPTIYDEPFADASQIPTHLVSMLARKHVTVALSGDGGDEILGGYDRHTVVPRLWNKMKWMPGPARKALSALILSIDAEKWSGLKPDHPQFGRRMHRVAQLMQIRSAKTLYPDLMASWPNPQKVVLGGSVPEIPLTDPLWQPAGLSLAERMMYADNLSYRPNDLMVKTDRASMAVALEVRAPLMDHSLYEYCASLPPEYKIRNGQGKWLLRQVLARHIPETYWDRPKMGFGVPVNDWLKGPLKEWAGDLLNKDTINAQGYLDADIIDKVWTDHLSGKSNGASSALWTALMFQAWYKQWKAR